MTPLTEPTPTAIAASAAPAAIADAEPARRLLTGDRLCIGCGYSLVHQPILREPTYGLLIVRCPECGDVAPVQEYPLLGRWASRPAAIGAGLWLLTLLGVLAVSTIGITAGGFMAWGLAGERPVTEAVEALALADTGIAVSGGYPPPEFQAWFNAEGPARIGRRILESPGRDWSLPGLAVSGLAFAPLPLAGGMVLAILLLHRRPATAALLGSAVTMGIAGLILWFNLRSELDSGIIWTPEVAFVALCWRIVLLGMLFNAMVLAAAVFFGRSITRWLIRLAVPPRMRGSLAFLWLADDLPPPPGVRNPRGPRVH